MPMIAGPPTNAVQLLQQANTTFAPPQLVAYMNTDTGSREVLPPFLQAAPGAAPINISDIPVQLLKVRAGQHAAACGAAEPECSACLRDHHSCLAAHGGLCQKSFMPRHSQALSLVQPKGTVHASACSLGCWLSQPGRCGLGCMN